MIDEGSPARACANCGAPMEEGQAECKRCAPAVPGRPASPIGFRKPCPNCSAPVAVGMRVCPKCKSTLLSGSAMDPEQRLREQRRLSSQARRMWIISCLLALPLLPVGILWGPFLLAAARRYRKRVSDLKLQAPGELMGLIFLGLLESLVSGAAIAIYFLVIYGPTMPTDIYLDNGYAHPVIYQVDDRDPIEVGAQDWQGVWIKRGRHHVVVRTREGSVVLDTTIEAGIGGKIIVNPGAQWDYHVRYEAYSKEGKTTPPDPVYLGRAEVLNVSNFDYVFIFLPGKVKVQTRERESPTATRSGVYHGKPE